MTDRDDTLPGGARRAPLAAESWPPGAAAVPNVGGPYPPGNVPGVDPDPSGENDLGRVGDAPQEPIGEPYRVVPAPYDDPALDIRTDAVPAGSVPVPPDTLEGDTIDGGDTLDGDTIEGDTVEGDTVAGPAAESGELMDRITGARSHAELDAIAAEIPGTLPDPWGGMTVSEKRSWLIENAAAL